MAGATVWRGLAGFRSSGARSNGEVPGHGDRAPLAIELLDAPDRIDAFLSVVRELAPGSFVTREQVEMAHFGAAPVPGLDDPGDPRLDDAAT